MFDLVRISGLIRICGVLLAGAAATGFPQTLPLQLDPQSGLVNSQSLAGYPLSETPGNPPGSDGRAPSVAQQSAAGLTTTQPTLGQFRSWVGFGALAAPLSPQNRVPNGSYADNAVQTGLPVGREGGQVVAVLQSARVGAPYLSRQVSFLFGSLVAVPETDEDGKLLANRNPPVRPEDYWFAEPHWPAGQRELDGSHQGAPYYWSPHARAVFAVQPGPITITWKRMQPSLTEPPDYAQNPANYSEESGAYYRLFRASHVVSGSAVKPPRRIYWTHDVFADLGKPVTVPRNTVGDVKVVYNESFPRTVPDPYVTPGRLPVADGVQTATEPRTLWYNGDGQILAYNREGRVFLELLGDLREDGITRQHLGFEIVDVVKQPTPSDVGIELGELLTAWQDGRDDSYLLPEPILSQESVDFTYRHEPTGSAQPQFYATQETRNLNDLLVHWLEAGELGLRWPYRLVRYDLHWPAAAENYSHYLRPEVATEAEAMETAVPLPAGNAPLIEYQDPLDFPRAKITGDSRFYTFLDVDHPAHRTLIRYGSQDFVAFERVFSWLAAGIKDATRLTGSVATTLSAWDADTGTMDWSAVSEIEAPRYVETTAEVGRRISPPPGEAESTPGADYWAGHIRVGEGDTFHPGAYLDPFQAGFAAANRGAILPVNAIPGRNTLEVWWFRENDTDRARGFGAVYWPSVVARYSLGWPTDAREIILASNDGSGALDSLEAKGTIYFQNDPGEQGYNPNEEHALLLGGQAYALRDDLNVTTQPGFSSEPFVLLHYLAADERPAMAVFKVRREKPEAGILFDYLVEAGTILQAPMPLPLLPKPVIGSGEAAVNYNTEPPATGGDLPGNWDEATHGQGPFGHYQRFTYQDRKNEFWVYRAAHAGLPALTVGTYNPATESFDPPTAAIAVAGSDFAYTLHASRLPASLTLAAATDTTLPDWLRIDGFQLVGRPTEADLGTLALELVVQAVDDDSTATVNLVLEVRDSGAVVSQAPLAITSFNAYAGTSVTYVDRPPYLAASPAPANSFTMRFYYKTQPGFAWPGNPTPPPVDSIVPYLRPLDAGGEPVGIADSPDTASLDIVYRPYWPFRSTKLPELRLSQTVVRADKGLPDVGNQTSLQILYQQSIAADLTAARESAVLHDPTREKSADLAARGLERLPAGVRTEAFQGKTYFPNLPPHLAERVFFDPNRGSQGHLVLRGEFRDELVGERYLLLNVLRDTDLAAVQGLCPTGDPDKTAWDELVAGLATTLETFRENLPDVPGAYVPDEAREVVIGVGELARIVDDETAVAAYALSASGPGTGYLTLIAGNGRAFTPEAEPVSMYVIKVAAPIHPGEIKVIAAANPLSEQLTFQHTPDLAGRFADFEYDWRIAPPVDGTPPPVDAAMAGWTVLTQGLNRPRFTLGGAGIQVLTDNYIVLRYRAKDPAHPAFDEWSDWTVPQLAEGWIKRVLAGINPFNQRVTDLFNNEVNTDVSILTQAGGRWEGDVALNLQNIDDYGLIEIYETVLRRGKMLSVGAGINYGPANDALLLAAGYLNDLYLMVGNEAWADASNPTIGIGTKDRTYGEISTALFAFKGQVASLLEEELALLRGRDDFLQPGVETRPVYNRLFWNYTRGIDAGEVIYALNYNIQEDQNEGVDGTVNAEDALRLYPQGHGDAYGHFLTALKGYYALLMDTDFDWMPRTEAVSILGKPVQVDYLDERKFAAAAAATVRAGRQVFDLTWRRDYQPDKNHGWEYLGETRSNTSRKVDTTRYWGADHWASRTGQGAYLHWVVGNAILPDQDRDPTHEGIQKIDRTTVPELAELVAEAGALQASLDNAEGRLSPLGLPEEGLAFDINPNEVVGPQNRTHFEQIYERATRALNNAVAAFDDAKDVTRLMRSEQDSLVELQTQVDQQELAYRNQLIELYGTPYTDDIGPGRTWVQGYAGPDLVHYMYVDLPEIIFPELWNHTETTTFKIDLQDLPSDWVTSIYENFDFVVPSDDPGYANSPDRELYLEYELGPHGFAGKPSAWTGQRASPGRLQQSISEIIVAHRRLKQALYDNAGGKADLDKAIRQFNDQMRLLRAVSNLEKTNLVSAEAIADSESRYAVLSKDLETAISVADMVKDVMLQDLPDTSIFGVAFGGDLMFPVRAIIGALYAVSKLGLLSADAIAFRVQQNDVNVEREAMLANAQSIQDLQLQQAYRQGVYDLFQTFEQVQAALEAINLRLRELDDAARKHSALLTEGERIQEEREIFRRRAAGVIQGYRTRDAAFRIFRNEKLERYKTLFELAARYTLLAANAYDYETGLLHTDAGRAFVRRILGARALGVVRDGQPQFAGSNTGDPGLSSVLAEMKADWDVLKGRLGFNNPDAYGTTFSLRTENFRILPGAEGDEAWRDLLERARLVNLLDDPDVRRHCMQIGREDGLPVPGIVVEFGTTIANGRNFFGQALAAGDHAFSPTAFATKVFAAGVALEGYQGMEDPSALSGAVGFAGGASPSDPSLSFLDPDALAATPYIYLIPVGLDSMRSPPLGDASVVRTWRVDDVTVPLPFNVGQSEFSAGGRWQSADFLTEPLFSVRKHQAFRPVSSATRFELDLFTASGGLAPSQFTNNRLIGRSAWNSRWKLVIPGHTLLNDPKEGLERFVRSVKDIRLHLVTYSYAGN
ncbi:MAG: hypothetical protein H7A47_09065 [Verrucomicrobiales bacterium]|nr:hypothetical protein [Verrucomicrobiales bacterium]